MAFVQETALGFEDLRVSGLLLHTLNSLGFLHPSPVQARCIPIGLSGNNVITQAKSGTGKTIAFTTVVLERINVGRGEPQAIVLAPTRELAVQIDQVFQQLSANLPGFRTVLCIGGTSAADNAYELNRACQVVIGTPGRIESLISGHILHADSVKILVLDEVDRLLESSMMDAVARIWTATPASKQILAFSATYSKGLQAQLKRVMPGAEFIRVVQEAETEEHGKEEEEEQRAALVTESTSELVVSKIAHARVGLDKLLPPGPVTPSEVLRVKLKVLQRLLTTLRYNQAIIFCNRGSVGQVISRLLAQAGIKNRFLSAELSQQQRLEAFFSMQQGEERILISTDVSSRGIDIEGCSLVINYDVPLEQHTYVHRVGRTGRYGARGCAISLVSPDDQETLAKYEAELGIKMIALLDEEADISRLKDVLPEQTKLAAALLQDLHGGRAHRSPSQNPSAIEEQVEQREASLAASDAASPVEGDYEEQLYLRWRAEAGLH